MGEKIKNSYLKDVIILGFALFAMFFGSGNVLFPPFLGLECGPEWLQGIGSYMISDILVAMLIFVAAVRIDGDVNSVTARLGKVPGKLILCIATVCIGPLFCIPRAAATTFDMLITPVFGATSFLWISIFVILFFTLTYFLCVKPNNVCDIIGKYLTPGLIIFIVFMVVKGIATPIGPYADSPMVDNVIQNGVIAGYQSMEVFGGLSVVSVVMASVKGKGYSEKKSQVKVVTMTTLVCFICLLMASVGMSYLGATASTLYDNSISQAVLVVNIAGHLFGNLGGVFLGILAGLACLTTAVGLTSGTAEYFSESFPKLKYERIVLGCCILGVLIACMGLKTIIAFAVPVLSLLYPVIVLMVIMSLFHYQIRKDAVFIGAAIGTFAVSACSMMESFGIHLTFTDAIPLFATGFGWVIPAIIGGIVGQIIGRKSSVE